MLNLSRRDVVMGAGFAAALGLNSRLSIIGPAQAQPAPDAGKGFHKYKVGSVEVTALYDGSKVADVVTEMTFEDGRKGKLAARVAVREMKTYPVPAKAMEQAA